MPGDEYKVGRGCRISEILKPSWKRDYPYEVRIKKFPELLNDPSSFDELALPLFLKLQSNTKLRSTTYTYVRLLYTSFPFFLLPYETLIFARPDRSMKDRTALERSSFLSVISSFIYTRTYATEVYAQ